MSTAIASVPGGNYSAQGIYNFNKINGKSAQSSQNVNKSADNTYNSRQKPEAAYSNKQTNDKITQMKRMIRGEDKKNPYGQNSIVESTLSYADQLKASRETAKNTSNEVKKLKYNFKDISSQIRRSKTSVNAKQVASAARREVTKLKLKKQSGKYDDEELSAAITHAEAMERAAKKKARHLMEEELIKITDDAPSAKNAINMEEQMEAERDKALEEIDKEMQALEEQLSEVSEEEMQEMQEAMEESMEETQEMMQDSMEEISSELLDEMGQEMQEMMEETFSDLADSMFVITDFEMTKDDFKELVKKHRTSEDKDMVKADMEYLKALFDHYNKMLGGAKSGGGGSQMAMASTPMASPVSMPAVSVNVSVPEGGTVDISV